MYGIWNSRLISGAGVIAEAEPFVDVRRLDRLRRDLEDRDGSNQCPPADRISLDESARRGHHDLAQPELVEQRVAVRHHAGESCRGRGQFLGDVAGVPVAAARRNLHPEIGAQVHALAVAGLFGDVTKRNRPPPHD